MKIFPAALALGKVKSGSAGLRHADNAETRGSENYNLFSDPRSSAGFRPAFLRVPFFSWKLEFVILIVGEIRTGVFVFFGCCLWIISGRLHLQRSLWRPKY